MANINTYLNLLPLSIREPLRQLFDSGATLTNSVVGNVAGNVTGNVTGDVTGNVTGVVTAKTSAGYYTMTGGTTVPASGTAGYAPSCVFLKTDAVFGQCGIWTNIGTAASCLFVPAGPTVGWGCVECGALATIGGDTQEDYILPELRAYMISFMDYMSTDDSDKICKQWPTTGSLHAVMSADPVTDHSIQYAVIDEGVVPKYDIFAAGKHTVVGTDNPVVITVAGVKLGDIVNVCHGTVNAAPRTIAKAVCTGDTITVELSGAPTASDRINYVVWRPRGSFKPSHYIAAAKIHTTVADAGGAPFTNAVSLPDALTSDIPIVQYNNSDDTDAIVLTAADAGIITVTMSADPDVAHQLACMAIRAY